MKQIVLGTHNKAKVAWINQLLQDYAVEFMTPLDIEIPTEEIIESGKTGLENAVIKATYYYNASHKACLSNDNELLFLEFNEDDERQPLTRVRRVYQDEYELTDQEMIDYYANLAKQNGGKLTAYYRSSYAVVTEKGEVFTFENPYEKDPKFIEAIAFYIVEKPHHKRNDGWPLDSLSKDIHTGKYWYDETKDDVKPQEMLDRYQEYIIEGKRLVKQFIVEHLKLVKKL